MSPTLVRVGFDTVEYVVDGRVPDAFLWTLANAKEKAQKARREQPIIYAGHPLLVYPSGGQGGFAYLISTGIYGAMIKFRDVGSNDTFCAHIKLSAYGLATKGLQTLKIECDTLLKSIGAVINWENTRIGRLDYALDFSAPDIILDSNNFITHANRSKKEFITEHSKGRDVATVTIGTMPRSQISIYDKLTQTNKKSDAIWQEIYSSALRSKNALSERSSWWRVELRLGKDAIDRFARPRLWSQVLASSASAFLNLSDEISWRSPTSDSNRSRWPRSPIWHMVQSHLVTDFGHFSPVEISEATKKKILNEHLAGLEAQSEGIVLTLAAMYGVDAEHLNKFVEAHFRKIGHRFSAREDIADQLTSRRERFALLRGS